MLKDPHPSTQEQDACTASFVVLLHLFVVILSLSKAIVDRSHDILLSHECTLCLMTVLCLCGRFFLSSWSLCILFWLFFISLWSFLYSVIIKLISQLPIIFHTGPVPPLAPPLVLKHDYWAARERAHTHIRSIHVRPRGSTAVAEGFTKNMDTSSCESVRNTTVCDSDIHCERILPTLREVICAVSGFM